MTEKQKKNKLKNMTSLEALNELENGYAALCGILDDLDCDDYFDSIELKNIVLKDLKTGDKNNDQIYI